MKTQRNVLTAFLVVISTATPCFAQGEKASEFKYFHLDFVVKELDGGKVINARNYSITISTATHDIFNNSSIRSGEKVPVAQPGGQVTYVEAGVNIDCRQATELPNQLAMVVTIDISGAGTVERPLALPLIRTSRWSSSVLVTLRKQTVIFSSDDASSKHQMQVDLTATPIPVNSTAPKL
ncbi:MAG: hypothetical protein M3Z09_05950 [Acidobacteriota bacterium]|nr:hypothetical protein [Acidobacteriota bacterium]